MVESPKRLPCIGLLLLTTRYKTIRFGNPASDFLQNSTSSRSLWDSRRKTPLSNCRSLESFHSVPSIRALLFCRDPGSPCPSCGMMVWGVLHRRNENAVRIYRFHETISQVIGLVGSHLFPLFCFGTGNTMQGPTSSPPGNRRTKNPGSWCDVPSNLTFIKLARVVTWFKRGGLTFKPCQSFELQFRASGLIIQDSLRPDGNKHWPRVL